MCINDIIELNRGLCGVVLLYFIRVHPWQIIMKGGDIPRTYFQMVLMRKYIWSVNETFQEIGAG
jgi:hypothetical protein